MVHRKEINCFFFFFESWPSIKFNKIELQKNGEQVGRRRDLWKRSGEINWSNHDCKWSLAKKEKTKEKKKETKKVQPERKVRQNNRGRRA